MRSVVRGGEQAASMKRWISSRMHSMRSASIGLRALTRTGWLAAVSVLLILTCARTHAQNGPFAYIANLNGTTSVIDTSTKTAVTTIPDGGSFDIAATSDGRTVYALRLGSKRAVVPINTATNTPGTPIPLPADS